MEPIAPRRSTRAKTDLDYRTMSGRGKANSKAKSVASNKSNKSFKSQKSTRTVETERTEVSHVTKETEEPTEEQARLTGVLEKIDGQLQKIDAEVKQLTEQLDAAPEEVDILEDTGFAKFKAASDEQSSTVDEIQKRLDRRQGFIGHEAQTGISTQRGRAYKASPGTSRA